MIGRVLTFIRFSHTLFALPFAPGAMLVAARGFPSARVFLLVLGAMVCARTAAMVFNRLADWEIDQRNPRTADRHRLVSRKVAVLLLLASLAGFEWCAWGLNWLCFILSPVAVAIILFYSFTKRFTAWSHLFLGLALAVSPVGAWLAVTGSFAWPPLLLAGGVVLWVAGFDIIYAAQDLEFDREEGLRSLVVKLGLVKSFTVARWFHVGMFVLLLGFGSSARLGALYFFGLALVVGALFYEHHMVRHGSIEKINHAFFLSNAFVGAAFVAAVLVDTL